MLGHITTGGASNWSELDDTPSSITALEFVRGNAGGTALEFAPIADNTIQEVYAASSDAEIDLTAAIGPIVLKDAATPTGDVLFSVQENDGTPLIQAGVDFDEGITFGKLRDDAGSPALKIFQSPDAFQSINVWPESMTFSQTFGSGINFGDHTKTYILNQNSGAFQGINQRGFYLHQSSTNSSFYSVIMNSTGSYRNIPPATQSFGPILIARHQVNVAADTHAVTSLLVGGIDLAPTFGNQNGGALTVNSYTGVRMGASIHLFDVTTRRVGLDFANQALGFGTLTDNVAVDIANLNYGTNRFGIRSAMAVGKFLSHTGVAVSELAGELRLLGDNLSVVFGAGQDADIYYDATDLIIDPDVAGTGRVLIGATGDDDMLLNDIEIDGALNHDGATVGFYGTAPAAQSAAYTRNATIVEDRTLLASASATTLNNNNVLAALIADLQNIGVLA